MGPQEKKRFDPSKSKRVTEILSFSLGRFYKDHPLLSDNPIGNQCLADLRL